MRNPLSSFTLAAAASAAAGSLAFAHPPHHAQPGAPVAAPPRPALPGPAGRNLQVLPSDIPQERLMLIMRDWGQALGVQCSYCHVPGDFRSDDNPHKKAARGMVHMTKRINQELLPSVEGGRVTCYTCHRGKPVPDPELPPPPEPPPPAPPGVTPPEPVRPPPAHIAPDTPARPY